MQTQSTPETLNPPGSQTLGLGLEPSPPSGDFAVGDLVWGKIKNHQPPWWPGHVSSLDESDKSVVVSYFGTKISCRCDPSRLKPFAENYDRMSRSSGNSKKRSFKAALNSALSEMGKCLEEQLSCNCNSSLLPEEDRRASRVVSKFSNYSAVEFLGLVKDAAVGCRVGGGVEVIKLRSWVVGFERGVNVGHQQKAISDLVEKIDLDDVPVIEAGEWEKEVEDKSLIVEASHSKGRKKRSMAELIAETGLDSEEEEEKNNESEKDLIGENDDVNVGGVKEEEEVGSSRRRERKKSKYLSPPYTYLSERGLATTLLSSKIPKALSSSKSFSGFEKCSSVEDFQKEEDKIHFDGIETGLVLSEFLVTATNPFHLKWNRLAKTVRGFFAEFRSSVFFSGAGFEAYQKKRVEYVPNNDVGVDFKEAKKTEENKETKRKDEPDGEVETSMAKSHECKRTDGRRRRKKNIQVPNGVQETPVELVQLTIEQCDKVNSAAGKRKKTKEEPNGNILQAVTDPNEGKSGRKRRRRKSDSNHNNAVGLSCATVNNVENNKESGQTLAKEMEPASTEIPIALGPKEETLGKNGKDGTVIDVPINLSGGNISNVSDEGKKSRQRKKNKKTQDPTALHLTFSSGITLPSIEQLVIACSQYGPLIESETELQMESSSGRVVFKKAADAEKAFNDKVGALGQLVASYHLSYPNGVFSSSPPPVQTPPAIEVPKPPLPYIRKSLERMISTLRGSGSPLEKVGAGASQDMKAEGMDNLVGEMHGLLSKVNKMLTGPAPGTSS